MKFCLNIVQDIVLSPHFNIVLLSLLFYMKLLCDSLKLVNLLVFYNSILQIVNIEVENKYQKWAVIIGFLQMEITLNWRTSKWT